MNFSISNTEIKIRDIDSVNFESEKILTSTEINTLSSITHPTKKKEFILTRVLFNEFELFGVFINYQDRKPILTNGYKISISHNQHYVGVAINPNKNIGIDIETISSRIINIKDKFCLKNEIENLSTFQANQLGNEETYYTLLWTAKEATFKAHLNQENVFINLIYVEIINSQQGRAFIQNNIYEINFIALDTTTVFCHSTLQK